MLCPTSGDLRDVLETLKLIEHSLGSSGSTMIAAIELLEPGELHGDDARIYRQAAQFAGVTCRYVGVGPTVQRKSACWRAELIVQDIRRELGSCGSMSPFSSSDKGIIQLHEQD